MDSFEFGSEYTSLEQLPAFYHASKTTSPLEATNSPNKNGTLMYAHNDVLVPVHLEGHNNVPLHMVGDNAVQQKDIHTPDPISSEDIHASSHFYQMLHEHMPADIQRPDNASMQGHSNYETFVTQDKSSAQSIAGMQTFDLPAFPMHGKLPPTESQSYMPSNNVVSGEPAAGSQGITHMSSFSDKSCPPLDSSGVTPASVFSKVSSSSTNDFLPPITSPMLQPQGSQQHVYGLNEVKDVQLAPDLLHMSSASSGADVPGPPDLMTGNVMMPNGFTHSITPSPTLSAEQRPALRRSRATDSKISRVRPSPLIKPVQSPKNVWQGRKRGGSLHSSPSLGAIESISNAMQDSSNGFSISSPALSPASMSLPRSNTVAKPLPARSSTMDETKSGASNPGHGDTQEHAERTPFLKSPSPIELANSDPTQPATQPATPGTLMGLAYSPRPSSAPVETVGSVTSTPALPPSTSSQQNIYYPPSYGGMNSYQTQNAVSAVTASALINASQPPHGMFFQGGAVPHKSFYPSGVSQDGPASWFNMRRAENFGLDQRRTSHKAAEQKRRDSLKHCFDELRVLLPGITVDHNSPGGSMLGPDGSNEDRLAEGFGLMEMSDRNGDQPSAQGEGVSDSNLDPNRTIAKVLLLRHSNEYLIRLKKRIERRDVALQTLSEEVVRLRSILSKQGISFDGEDAKVSSELSSLSIKSEKREPPTRQDVPVGHPQNQDAPSRDVERPLNP